MFDTINGSPVHPLVVHAIVVLLPLAALGTLAIVAVPRWRLIYGPLVLGAAALSTALVPAATASGESLEEKVGDPGRHAALGEQLVWFALPLTVLLAVLLWMEWRVARREDGDASTGLGWPGWPGWTNLVAVLAVIAALAVTVQVIRVGDSGAQAVWGNAQAVAVPLYALRVS